MLGERIGSTADAVDQAVRSSESQQGGADIASLLRRVRTGQEGASDAAAGLSLIARKNPESLEGHGEGLIRALEETEDNYIRRLLTETVYHAVESDSIEAEAAGRALTEATRLPEELPLASGPQSPLAVVRMALKGWNLLAKADLPVPRKVTERAIRLADTDDLKNVIPAINVLGAAAKADSQDSDLATQMLFWLASSDDEDVRSEAVKILFELIDDKEIEMNKRRRRLVKKWEADSKVIPNGEDNSTLRRIF